MVVEVGRRIEARSRARTGSLTTTDADSLHGSVDPVSAGTDSSVTGETGGTTGISLDVSLSL